LRSIFEVDGSVSWHTWYDQIPTTKSSERRFSRHFVSEDLEGPTYIVWLTEIDADVQSASVGITQPGERPTSHVDFDVATSGGGKPLKKKKKKVVTWLIAVPGTCVACETYIVRCMGGQGECSC